MTITDLGLLVPITLVERGFRRAMAQRFGRSLTLPGMRNFKAKSVYSAGKCLFPGVGFHGNINRYAMSKRGKNN